MSWESLVPSTPPFAVDWAALRDALPWLRDLERCEQDPGWHAEGNVEVHTRLAIESLIQLPSWQALSETDRTATFLAVLYHDIAKPACTRTDTDGRIIAPGHSSRGSILTRIDLWQRGVPFGLREQVASLVRSHQVPYFLFDRENPERVAISLSHTTRCDHLRLVAEADIRGRVAEDGELLLENMELYESFCRELGCYGNPWDFDSDHARFKYFRSAKRAANAPAFDDTRCEVLLMSGLPGAGKDRWIQANAADLPMVSLDEIRVEMGVSTTKHQGAVANEARERARRYLRNDQGFVWNATNLSRDHRERCISLFDSYGARVRIVYVEVSPDRLAANNMSRQSPVPERAIERLLRRWEVPDRTEAHAIEFAVE